MTHEKGKKEKRGLSSIGAGDLTEYNGDYFKRNTTKVVCVEMKKGRRKLSRKGFNNQRGNVQLFSLSLPARRRKKSEVNSAVIFRKFDEKSREKRNKTIYIETFPIKNSKKYDFLKLYRKKVGHSMELCQGLLLTITLSLSQDCLE